MRKQLRKFVWAISALVFMLFVLFATNQLLTFYANISEVNPLLAKVVTGFLTIVVLGLLLSPVVLYLKLPKALIPPQNPEEQDVYRARLRKRLRANGLLKNKNISLSTDEDLKEALKILDEKANTIINDTATSVFLTTAVSQNGKLDAFTVLVTQCKMIWSIAHLYWQRPSLKDMSHLYGNVGAAAFLASEIEDIDLSRQIEPILNAVVKSPGRSIPLVGHAAHILTDSLLEGSTNAFLTLRVGVIAKRYCGSLEVYQAKKVKKHAFMEASIMLKSLMLATSGKIIKGLVKATKDTGVNTLKSGAAKVGKVTTSMKDGIRLLTKKKKDRGTKTIESSDKTSPGPS